MDDHCPEMRMESVGTFSFFRIANLVNMLDSQWPGFSKATINDSDRTASKSSFGVRSKETATILLL